MKRILLVVVAVFFAGVSFAQQKSSVSSQVVKTEKKNNFDEWSKELNLTDAQKQQIVDIQEKYKTEKTAIRKTGTVEQFKTLNAKQEAEIKAVLTPEQVQKAEAIKERKILEKNEKAAMKSAVR